MDRKDFVIVAGSYERLLYGLKASWIAEDTENDSKKLEIKPIFIFPAHGGCIKTVASGGKFLASGSTDEIIKLYDMKKLRELGQLSEQSGTITCLSFYKQTHLLSASEDGTICVFRSKDWELLKTLKGHRDRVNSIAIHPTGKLALSTGKDKTLRMWDLVTGHQAYKTNLKKEVDRIIWSIDGKHYCLVYPDSVGKEIWSVVCKQRILCATFISESSFIFSGEDKKLHSIDFELKEESVYDTDHQTRVKDMTAHDNILITCSSDGMVRCWDWNNNKPELIGEYNADVRLTCVTAQ